MPDEPADNSAQKPSAPPPAWIQITGIVFAALTLVYVMGLSIFASQLKLDAQSRFFVIASFGLGVALATGLLGWSAAASGQLAIPFAKNDPVKFSAAGGIGALVISMVLANLIYPQPGGATVGGGVQTPTPVATGDQIVSSSCFYFQTGSYNFVLTTPELRASQLDYVRALLASYGTVSIEGFGDPGMQADMRSALANRRAESVKAYLTSNGIAADRVATISFGKSDDIGSQAPTDTFAAATCLARLTPGTPTSPVVSPTVHPPVQYGTLKGVMEIEVPATPMRERVVEAVVEGTMDSNGHATPQIGVECRVFRAGNWETIDEVKPREDNSKHIRHTCKFTGGADIEKFKAIVTNANGSPKTIELTLKY